jgi:arabinose-5-phosphate isomerase
LSEKNYIKQRALQTLRIESDAIARLVQNIDDDFCKCVELIANCKARVIVTGVGKSAIIAQKIVSTLNSTGTASFFLHAADALHGDVGMIRKEDLVLVLSKSGETPELKALIPLLKSWGQTIIGMCSSDKSYLALNVDILIHVPVAEEADPNNLAPTASSIAHMAMGDAIAISLLSFRGFTKEQFALFHPGGSIGKQMYLKVKDLSQKNQRPCVNINQSIKDAIVEMTSKRLGAVVVLDDNEQTLGIITDGDIRRMLEKTENISKVKLENVLGTDPKFIEEDELAVKALEILRKYSINQLLVNRNGQYIGMVHLHDILREGII